jgi:two-component system chemotaxis sensor kinase CheA
MDDILQEFLSESFENLEKVDNELLDLERNPDDKEVLTRIFRSIHTIKGTSGFFGFDKLESVTHVGENMLARLRDGELVVDAAKTSALFKLVDTLRDMLKDIARDRQEHFTDHSDLIQLLTALADDQPVASSDSPQDGAVLKAPTRELSPLEQSEHDELEEVLREFLSESDENLEQVDRDLLILEQDPDAKEVIANIFRTIHTIKGTCGFLGLSKLEAVTHAGESLLSKLRDGVYHLEKVHADALFGLVDTVREILGAIRTERNEGEGDYVALIEQLSRLAEGDTSPSLGVPLSASKQVETSTDGGTAPDAAAVDKKVKTLNTLLTEGSIRVDVGVLDVLMNLVGELVLTRNQLLEQFKESKQESAASAYQRLNQLTRELQDVVMKTRMQPIRTIWSKFPRQVRDLANASDKRVRLEMEGSGTELDRAILEAINAPLTHLVRNAVDHGLEVPETRAANGKPIEGRLLLRAYHEGDLVNIEVQDDGAGIDVEKIRAKGVERGLVNQEDADNMREHEVLNLIFLPGFSTAEQVTKVSGRGVGMDVVLTHVEKLGGTVEVQTKVGEGTCFRIKLPLTLTIVPALVVVSDGQRYAIPQVAVLEVTRPGTGGKRGGVEMVHGAPVMRLRDKMIPLVFLSEVLELMENPGDDTYLKVAAEGNVVVLRAGDRRFGLVVNGILDTLEIVVRPLVTHLKGGATFSGATVLGDGGVALILDTTGLAERSQVIPANTGRVQQVAEQAPADPRIDHRRQHQVLLCRNPKGGGLAMLLDQVVRLEELTSGVIDHIHGQMVLQSAGEILPVIDLIAWVNTKSPTAMQTLSMEIDEDNPPKVVICEHEDIQVALVVPEIVNIVDSNVEMIQGEDIQHVRCIVIENQVSELVHVQTLLEECRPLLLERVDSSKNRQ